MNYSNYSFTLDLQIHQSQISIPVSLKDTARKLYITFIDGRKPYTIPDGCRAIFVGFKPDGTTLFNDCIIQENKTVIYEFTEQTAKVEGIVNCEIRLYGKDGKQLTSSQFIMIVDENVTRDISLSENESTAIDNIIHAEIGRVEAEAEREAAEEIRNAAEEKRIETEEEIKELANVLKPLAPFILQSPYLDDLDRPCYILDVGKEYKGEAEEVIHHSLIGYFTGGEGSAYSPYIFAEQPIKEFTIKIIGFEGSILTYEYNREIRTYDCSVNPELTPPYELQRVVLVWRGDLYLCNPNGIKDGKDGVGISSIRCTSANSGSYRIEFTDGTYFDFIVPNGKDGADGKTPYIEDGTWWIGKTNTGVKAEGKEGKSAYEIVVEYGYEGTEEEWANGLNPDKLVEKVLDTMEQAEDWVL